MDKMVLFSGGAAVGKTAVLRHVVSALRDADALPAVCKIDCVGDDDRRVFAELGVPAVAGISGDVCPDHFLVSNLPELWAWTEAQQASHLLIETAGLCHRCSPATRQMLAGCVIDCTASCRTPGRLGPMLTQADFAVVAKTDMVSQAEREIICSNIERINPAAEVFCADALAGYGIEALCDYLLAQPPTPTYENDALRHTMPMGVCSYCVGERRVGTAFQQGIVGKIDFSGSSGSDLLDPSTAEGGAPCQAI